MCLRAIKTKHCSCSAYLSSLSILDYNIDLYFKQAIQFVKPKTKGRQIWPPPRAAKGLATTLHWRADAIIGSALNCLWHLKISVTTPRFQKRHWFVGAYFDVHQPIFMTLAEMLLRENGYANGNFSFVFPPRHMRVNNFPKVVTWKRKARSRTRDLRCRKSNALTTTPPDESPGTIRYEMLFVAGAKWNLNCICFLVVKK